MKLYKINLQFDYNFYMFFIFSTKNYLTQQKKYTGIVIKHNF